MIIMDHSDGGHHYDPVEDEARDYYRDRAKELYPEDCEPESLSLYMLSQSDFF